LYYGQAIFQTGDVEKAAQILKKINRRYSNYPERLMLALFLKDNGKEVDAIELLEELMDEGRHHAQPNKRKYKMVFADIEKLQKELAS
jgi:TolA-binding protein